MLTDEQRRLLVEALESDGEYTRTDLREPDGWARGLVFCEVAIGGCYLTNAGELLAAEIKAHEETRGACDAAEEWAKCEQRQLVDVTDDLKRTMAERDALRAQLDEAMAVLRDASAWLTELDAVTSWPGVTGRGAEFKALADRLAAILTPDGGEG